MHICKIVVHRWFLYHRFLYYYNKSYTLKLYNMLYYIFLILIIKCIQTLKKEEWNQIKYQINSNENNLNISNGVKIKIKKFSQVAIKPLSVSIISTMAFLRVNSLCVRFPCTVAIRTSLPRSPIEVQTRHRQQVLICFYGCVANAWNIGRTKS